MQQLRYQLNGDIIIIENVQGITSQEFEWLQSKLKDASCTLRDNQWGADRGQCYFSYKSQDYVLFFEALSNSLWIEAMTKKSCDIEDLYRLMLKKC